MQLSGSAPKACLVSATLLFSCPILIKNAAATQPSTQREAPAVLTTTYQPHSAAMRLTVTSGLEDYRAVFNGNRAVNRIGGISCVPYAREVSGIRVAGNAWQWWNNARGLYARGDQPEDGSVLNFRPIGRMQLGHVAVVKRVVNPREVIIDHANWANGGRITHSVAVVDVSEANNWSAVRVELGRPGEFGSIYPTYGFIYNRPDTGTVLASVARPAPQPNINPVPSDLRPAAERPWRVFVEEVAQSPGGPTHHVDTPASQVVTLR